MTVTENDVFGDCVNVAAKIEKATRPDEIYFTESVFLAMNKAEVPNVFVKNFRPKGKKKSHEIKLYKVIQDAADERYARLIRNTGDSEPTKTYEALRLRTWPRAICRADTIRWPNSSPWERARSRKKRRCLPPSSAPFFSADW